MPEIRDIYGDDVTVDIEYNLTDLSVREIHYNGTIFVSSEITTKFWLNLEHQQVLHSTIKIIATSAFGLYVHDHKNLHFWLYKIKLDSY